MPAGEELLGRFGTLRLGAEGESAEPFRPILRPVMLFAGTLKKAGEGLCETIISVTT